MVILEDVISSGAELTERNDKQHVVASLSKWDRSANWQLYNGLG